VSAAVTSKRPAIAVGVRVQIIGGMAKGVTGTVLACWPTTFGGEPQWVIGSGDLVRRRVIRAAYLEVLP
jgi:urease alpha subunit